MSAPLSPAIERFLAEWEATKGFRLTWRVNKRKQLRAEVFDWGLGCCPLTAKSMEVATTSARLPDGDSHESFCVMDAADNYFQSDPAIHEIRARLLAAVGLA